MNTADTVKILNHTHYNTAKFECSRIIDFARGENGLVSQKDIRLHQLSVVIYRNTQHLFRIDNRKDHFYLRQCQVHLSVCTFQIF